MQSILLLLNIGIILQTYQNALFIFSLRLQIGLVEVGVYVLA